MHDFLDQLAPYAHWLLGGALILGGVFGGLLHRSERRWALASASWPSVVGRVVRSQPSLLVTGGSTDAQIEATPRHTLEVEYTYTVRGQTFSSDVYRFGAPLSGAFDEIAADAKRRLPAGTAVQVFYDPAAPARAVLERGAEEVRTLPWVLAIVAVVAGIWVCWQGIPGWAV